MLNVIFSPQRSSLRAPELGRKRGYVTASSRFLPSTNPKPSRELARRLSNYYCCPFRAKEKKRLLRRPQNHSLLTVSVLLKVHVPPSVHGNNGVTLLHSPGVVQYSPKRSLSATDVASRGVSSPPSDVSPSGSPVKKFAASNEHNNKRTPNQLPWTHIKIQTQPKGNKLRIASTKLSIGES